MWVEGELAKKEASDRTYLRIIIVLSSLYLSLALMLMCVLFISPRGIKKGMLPF